MPWALAKDESKKDRLAAVMNILCEGLYKIAFLIAPYMPMSAQKNFKSIRYRQRYN